MKYTKQECPQCGRSCKTLYRPIYKLDVNGSQKHQGPNLCYWCNQKRVKDEQAKRK